MYFLNNRRITWAPSVRRGLDSCYPRKFWNFDALKRYSCVLRGRFLSKMFSKLSVIFMPIFICVFSHASTRSCFIFQAVYLRFQGITWSALFKVFLGIYQHRCENQDFSYPDRILVGIRDFQAKSGESRRDRDGWTSWISDWNSNGQKPNARWRLRFPFPV